MSILGKQTSLSSSSSSNFDRRTTGATVGDSEDELSSSESSSISKVLAVITVVGCYHEDSKPRETETSHGFYGERSTNLSADLLEPCCGSEMNYFNENLHEDQIVTEKFKSACAKWRLSKFLKVGRN